MIGTRRQKLHNEPLIILHVEKAALSRHMKAKHVLTMTPTRQVGVICQLRADNMPKRLYK